MRIALVYDALYPDAKGGVEKRVWEIASRMAQQDHDVHLLVPKSWSGSDRIARDGVTLRGVCRSTDLYTSSGRRAVAPALRHAVGVWRLLRRERFDVVDCQIPAHPAAIGAWAALRGSETNLLVTWHEAWDGDWVEEMGILGHPGRLVERLVAHIPARHLAVSPHTASILDRIGGSAEVVIPPGVDLAALRTDPASADDDCDVLFVGRLVPTKNLTLLIDSTAELVREGLDVSVRVVGDGPSRPESEARVHELDLGSHIEFVGALEQWVDVMAEIKSAKTLALPSLREGFGMVALEAAACGVPVVTVDHRRNASRHVVDDGVTGFCVPAEPSMFAAAIRKLLTDEPLRAGMGEVARQKAQASDWKAVVSATEAQYMRAAS